MRVFTTTWFQRFAKKEGILDESLKNAVALLEKGMFDADLGGGVFKQRLARQGGGKSGGYRIILCLQKAERAFLIYGFAKSDIDNIAADELAAFKKTAKLLLSYGDAQLDEAVRKGVLGEMR
jgi:hypothetical protein